jgi:SAM-dependent methyltransferase
MFNLQFLSCIRKAEFDAFVTHLRPGCAILEIGGGTGEQAALFQSYGFNIISLDVSDSNYTDNRCFPVLDYDGKNFPIPDNSIDIVFSSNVLEHISDLATTHTETKRVLKKDGYAVHIMPSHTWRNATSIAHYCDLGIRVYREMLKCAAGGWSLTSAARRLTNQTKVIINTLKHGRTPPRHGERGTIWNEAGYFHPKWWISHFESHGMGVVKTEPLGIFYTGHMLLGKRLGIKSRKALANCVGSACYMYVVKPTY